MRARLLALLLATLAATACRAHSDVMEASKLALEEAPGKVAQLVFVRPSQWAGNRLVSIVDERGTLLGQLEGASHFAVRLPPGKHRFVAWASNTAVLDAQLGAGKTYFVEVALRGGSWGPAVELLAVGRDRGRYDLLGTWLKQCQRFEPQPGEAASFTREHKGAIAAHLGEADQVLAGYGEELPLHQLRPSDGIAGMPFSHDADMVSAASNPTRPSASASSAPSPAPSVSAAAGASASADAIPSPSALPTASTPAPETSAPPSKPEPAAAGASCQQARDCQAGLECLGGHCLVHFDCQLSRDCPGGMRCQAGVCVKGR